MFVSSFFNKRNNTKNRPGAAEAVARAARARLAAKIIWHRGAALPAGWEDSGGAHGIFVSMGLCVA